MPVERRKLTPPQIATMWGISVDKVLAWIRNGDLRAINAATKRSGRPRYLVDPSALESFENRRSVVAKQSPVRRRRHKGENVVEFF